MQVFIQLLFWILVEKLTLLLHENDDSQGIRRIQRAEFGGHLQANSRKSHKISEEVRPIGGRCGRKIRIRQSLKEGRTRYNESRMTIEIFGWTIQFRVFKRKRPQPNSKGLSGFLHKDGPKVSFKYPWFYLSDHEGYAMHCCTDLVIKDSVKEVSTVTATFLLGGMTEYKERPKQDK